MIVICDMGGTLSNGSPIRGLVDWVGKNQSSLRANMYMASILPSYLLAKRGLLDWNSWVGKLMTTCLPLVKNATPELFEEICEHAVETRLWPERREDMTARIQQHIQDGDQVYIASGGWEVLIQAFAARIGAEGMGTRTKVEDGQIKLAEPITHGKHKIDMVFGRLGVEKVEVAYGDTHADILLLERADHPVAVYPDEKLKAVAKQRGWEIIGEGDT